MAITAARVLTILEKYGAAAVFHLDTPSFDPAISATTRTGAATTTAKVVEENREDRITGGADVLLYLSPAGLSFVPKVGGLVDYKGRTWTIASVLPIVYQGLIVLYEMGVQGVAL
jgi:hypothetical protein